MAFDYGERRIGVAFANTETSLATALTTLTARNGEPDWTELDALVAEWQPGVLIAGVPYNMDDSESLMTTRAKAFAEKLESRYALAVELIDERLTSAEASDDLRQQRETGVRKRRIRKGEIDRHAARIIAESWLQNDATINKKA